jgi:hypothetical protein
VVDAHILDRSAADQRSGTCAAAFPVFKMKQTTRDNFIYLGVAGVVVALLALYVFYTDHTMGRIPKIPGPILWGMFSTPVIVALVLERFWQYRRRYTLWIVSFVSALVNVAVIVVAYLLRWQAPLIVWSTATVAYVAITFFVTEKLMNGDRAWRK